MTDTVRKALEHAKVDYIEMISYIGNREGAPYGLLQTQRLIDEALTALAAPSPDAGRQTIALWMMGHGYATGHGDTIEDLLGELETQAKEHAGRPLVTEGDEVVRLRQFVDFVNLWCNRKSKITDSERLSAIKYHPTARAALPAAPQPDEVKS